MYFHYNFILRTVYIIGARAIASILSSVNLRQMMYCTADTKETPESVQGVGVDF
jgi:hypothetical protein